MPHQDSEKVYTNFQMEKMADSLMPLLSRNDVVGYAAARNIRSLQSELEDYINMKNKLIVELGTDEVDENGEKTGNTSIKVGTKEFDAFIEKMQPVGETRCYPTITMLDAEECINRLSGKQMLEFEWMIDYAEGGETN